MENIVIIIPLHEYNEDIKKLLMNAINSVPNELKVRISLPNTVYINSKEDLESLIETNRTSNRVVELFVNDDTRKDFCTLVNNAVSSEDGWFSILEFDDEYNDIWFKNVENEIKYKSDVSVFMPLSELIDFNDKKFIAYGNEAPWASSFSNEIGFVDNDCLQEYFDFYLTGSVFNAKDWVLCGGLKPSIKLTFWYEFLLRLTNMGKKIYVIPKLGYKHYVNRDGSLYDIYRKTINEDESKWWYELAKEEYVVNEDRGKTYNK